MKKHTPACHCVYASHDRGKAEWLGTYYYDPKKDTVLHVKYAEPSMSKFKCDIR